jgi:hypothetical protein
MTEGLNVRLRVGCHLLKTSRKDVAMLAAKTSATSLLVARNGANMSSADFAMDLETAVALRSDAVFLSRTR